MIDRYTFLDCNGWYTSLDRYVSGARGAAVNRLAEYENTGLEPKEIVKLKAERDAAVRDLKEYGTARGFTCEVCTHKRGTKYTPCFYPDGVDVDDDMCRTCGRCKCGHCDGVSQWEWRGPQQEET